MSKDQDESLKKMFEKDPIFAAFYTGKVLEEANKVLCSVIQIIPAVDAQVNTASKIGKKGAAKRKQYLEKSKSTAINLCKSLLEDTDLTGHEITKKVIEFFHQEKISNDDRTYCGKTFSEKTIKGWIYSFIPESRKKCGCPKKKSYRKFTLERRK